MKKFLAVVGIMAIAFRAAAALSVTGNFANVALPNKWKAFPQATRVVIGYANGTLLLFR